MTIINVPGTHTVSIDCKFLHANEVKQNVDCFVKYHWRCESYRVYREKQIIYIEFTNSENDFENEIEFAGEYGNLLANVLKLYKEIDNERSNA